MGLDSAGENLELEILDSAGENLELEIPVGVHCHDPGDSRVGVVMSSTKVKHARSVGLPCVWGHVLTLARTSRILPADLRVT